MKKRGTWYHPALRQWYEIDGFLMKQDQRHKFARRVCTVGEVTISDHKPKKLRIEVKKNRVWQRKMTKRIPRVRWEKLREEETLVRYREKIAEIVDAIPEDGTIAGKTKWNEMVEITNKAAEEACGVEEKRIQNPWMIGKDEEIQQMRERISRAISERDRLNEEREEREEIIRENREEIREARKILKKRVETGRKNTGRI